MASVTATNKAIWTWGVGRRKTAVARVRIKPGTGILKINKRDLTEYFKNPNDRVDAMLPFTLTDAKTRYDIYVNMHGGGMTGQAGAMKLGIARALSLIDEGYEANLRGAGLLTRDSRMKERKKYGKRGARRSPQYSKR